MASGAVSKPLEPTRVAVILAAGASSRFGGRPKALLEVNGETAIGRIARVAGEAGFAPAIAVVGAHRVEIERSVSGSEISLVDHPEWARGRTGSLQAGLDSLPGAEEALVWPVDHPFVAGSTLERLRAAADHDPLAIWFLPEYRGQGGHPVLLRRPAFASVRELNAASPLRSLLPRLGPQVRRVPVEDPGVLENADSPDAFWAALEAFRARNEGNDGS